jgi:MFS family permease
MVAGNSILYLIGMPYVNYLGDWRQAARARGTSISYMIGALASRNIVPRLGRKRSTILSLVSLGVLTPLYLAEINLYVSIAVVLIVCFMGGVNHPSSQGLNLEQIPSLRGPMMSMVSALANVGSTVSLTIGGLLLIRFGWRVMGLVMGSFGLIGCMILYLFAEEPE